MYESPAELAELQGLLDTSLRGSTAHLRSIVAPENTAPNTLNAEQLARALTGMCTLAISTVTAKGEPRISGVDGHFLHGRWIVGTDRGAAKARHLAARPAVSVAHLRGEALGVFTHGRAVPIAPPDADDPQWPEVLDHLTRHYGSNPVTWGDIVYYRIEPHWMVAYCADPKQVLPDT